MIYSGGSWLPRRILTDSRRFENFPSQKELGILGVTEMCYGVPAVKGLSSLQRLLSLTVIKPSIMVGIQFANWTITMFDR